MQRQAKQQEQEERPRRGRNIDNVSLDSEKRRFECPHCEWRFARKEHLERHSKTIHFTKATEDGGSPRTSPPRSLPKQLPCPYCTYTTDRKDNMRKHLLSRHPNEPIPQEFKVVRHLGPRQKRTSPRRAQRESPPRPTPLQAVTVISKSTLTMPIRTIPPHHEEDMWAKEKVTLLANKNVSCLACETS